ncbi:hypothetical protein [Streptomyces silaceus]|uniref:hypothetical protein n=1 Tax=Streptomyces silaceus TaxID=545123 RepID=UPI0031338CEA
MPHRTQQVTGEGVDTLGRRASEGPLPPRGAEAHGRAHVYEFAWRSPAVDGLLGAAHTVELPFVFDRLGLAALRGPHGLLGAAEPPLALAEQMHAAWVAFARTGDPGRASFDQERRIHRFDDAGRT